MSPPSATRFRCPPARTSCSTSPGAGVGSGHLSADPGCSALISAKAGTAAPATTPRCCSPQGCPASDSAAGRSGRPMSRGAATTWPTPSARPRVSACSAGESCWVRGSWCSSLGRDTTARGWSAPGRGTGSTTPRHGCTSGCAGTRRGPGGPARCSSTPGRPCTSTTTSTPWAGWPRRRPRSGSSGSCSTTGGSAGAVTTAPAWGTGRSTRRRGPRGCTRSSTR